MKILHHKSPKQIKLFDKEQILNKELDTWTKNTSVFFLGGLKQEISIPISRTNFGKPDIP